MDAMVDLAPGSDERRAILLEMYRQVCASHAAIIDFRAKLLALLPIASGAGIGLLLLPAATGDDAPGVLLALGGFGALVTGGLFLYELRQIDVCKQLRNHGAWLERQLGVPAGQFGGRRRELCAQLVYSRRRRCKRDHDLGDLERHGARDENEDKAESWLQTPFIGAAAAGYLIYHAVIAAWLLVAVVGVATLLGR